jgi:hypothetical protein
VDETIPATGTCTCIGTVPTARAYHDIDCPNATLRDQLAWARDVLADPKRAAVEMSGMPDEDLRRILPTVSVPAIDIRELAAAGRAEIAEMLTADALEAIDAAEAELDRRLLLGDAQASTHS